MAGREREVGGLEYLTLVTTLLQRARLASPTGGVWEAADLQWWWRRDQHPDPRGQTFWLDDDGPVAAVVLQDWGDRRECVLLDAAPEPGPLFPVLWHKALERIDTLEAAPVDLIVRDDDDALIAHASAAGFTTTDEGTVISWMRPDERRPVPLLASGFTLTARDAATDRPHHMIARNGPEVAARLAECSLYRPGLDLAIYASTGEVAAYGLFWPDPVTGVGLVEPMRTEDRFQGLGLAKHLFAVGLDRLAHAGCTQLKVGHDPHNEPARRVYLGAGFHPGARARTYHR